MERIGVFGGSFDPIHIGHLAMAETVCGCLGLTQVLFVPTGQQPLKAQHRGTPEQRLAMVKLAIVDNPLFEASEIETTRSGLSYSVDTMRRLAKKQPDATWWFMIGADAAQSLNHWFEIERLARMVRFAIVGRPGFELDEQALQEALPDLKPDRCVAPLLDISATMLRDRIAQGLSIRYLVPEGVRQYIHSEGLYLL